MMIPSPLVGVSRELSEIRSVIRKISHYDNYVLVRGESGSGKELVARWIHALSARKNGPFVAVNAGAFPGELIESEIFGYEKGAFTGAEIRKPGKIEIAGGGTFFLDEIGDLPLHLQVKLLRVLQERSFERLGGVEQIDADVRFLAATHRDLESMIRLGDFREDLYYRLNVITINIPPLRERPEDIRYIARYFIRSSLGYIPRIEEAVFEYLEEFSWYGNIRELFNNLQRVLIFMPDGDEITLKDAKGHIRPSALPREVRGDPVFTMEYKQALREFKRNYIHMKLRKNNWHQAATAKEIGMDRTYLSKLIRELNIERFSKDDGRK